MVLSLVFVRSYNFGWSPVYDCKAYLETNTVKNCSYFGFGEYFLVSGTHGLSQSVSPRRNGSSFSICVVIIHM